MATPVIAGKYLVVSAHNIGEHEKNENVEGLKGILDVVVRRVYDD